MNIGIPDSSSGGISELLDMTNASNKQHDIELKKKEKLPEDLVFSGVYKVDSIFGLTGQVSYAPISKAVMGGESPVHNCGYSSLNEILVSSVNAKGNLKSINMIIFEGPFLPLYKGDFIRSYFFLGKPEELLSETGPFFSGKEIKPTVLIERLPEQKECAFKIEKLVNGEIVSEYLNKTLLKSKGLDIASFYIGRLPDSNL